MSQEKITDAIQQQTALLNEAFVRQAEDLERFAAQVVDAFNTGGRLLVVGTGALGAIGNIIANLFLHRLSLERPPLPALSLGHDLTMASALARDGQSRQYFSRQLRIVATASDIVLILADSGRDEALEEALNAARQTGCTTAMLRPDTDSGSSEDLDFNFTLKTDSPPRIVEGSLFFGHILCELIEGELFGI